MHVLYVCKSLPHSFQGGIQTHVWKLSEWMLQLGHRVSILTAGSLKNGVRQADMGGRSVIELPYLPGRKLPLLPASAEETCFNLAARRWLLKNQRRFDLVHLQGRSGNLFLKNKAQVRVPVVNTLHGLVCLEQEKSVGRKPSPDSRLHRRLATRMENFALENAGALIAVSREMQAELAARNTRLLEKTSIISNGVDVPDDALPAVPTDPNLLLFVGRLTAIKGVFPLVEAMRRLPERIRLVMVGEGDARPALERLTRELRLCRRVEFAGAQDGAQVRHWMQRCHALVLPSFHETQGIVLLEANAAGKPVAAHAVGGVPEVVEHGENGLLMPSNAPQDIAAAVLRLFEQPAEARRMGDRGRVLAREKFSWEKIAATTAALYEKLKLPHAGKNWAA